MLKENDQVEDGLGLGDVMYALVMVFPDELLMVDDCLDVHVYQEVFLVLREAVLPASSEVVVGHVLVLSYAEQHLVLVFDGVLLFLVS